MVSNNPKSGAGERRRGRRPSGEVRRAILDAARHRLAEGGPEAIRLTQIAEDVRFGSRDGLTQALAQDAQDRLSAEVLSMLSAQSIEGAVAPLVRQIFDTLGDSGHARLLAWRGLALDKPRPEHSEQDMLQRLTDAIHLRRVEAARRRGEPAPDREEAAFLVRLVGTTLVGDAILGPIFELRAELDGQHESRERFRDRLADLVARLMADPDFQGGAHKQDPS